MNYMLGHASGGLGATSHRGLRIYRSDTCRAMGFLNTQETTRRSEQSPVPLTPPPLGRFRHTHLRFPLLSCRPLGLRNG